MILFIDASNIRAGGGVTHLYELLRAATPASFGFEKVIIYSCKSTLSKIEDRDWLLKKHTSIMELNFIFRAFWQKFVLPKLLVSSGADILFVPGGSFSTLVKPVVTISQNLLPFMSGELIRFGVSLFTIKLLLLRLVQAASFRKADGVIFLTDFARRTVLTVSGRLSGSLKIIPHGIDSHFFCYPRQQKCANEYSRAKPFRLLYVSIIDAYKHQWNVARAVNMLRLSGLPIAIDFIGPANPKYLPRLLQEVAHDRDGLFVRYLGAVPFDELNLYYKAADAFVFSSSCENMPNILIEGMAAGLPIACSDRGPMPEVLGDAGVYFDPESCESIALAIKRLFESDSLREVISDLAFAKANSYSWEQCANQTFRFLSDVASPLN